MMQRPLLLSIVPARIRSSLYFRLYSRRHAAFAGLFEQARLAFAPDYSLYDLVPGDVISGHIAFTGHYEEKLSKEIGRLARNGGLFVDVGANMGYFSVIWAAARPGNRVVAFEASPRIVPLIQRNISRNGLEDRITLIAKAASDRDGVVLFDTGPAEQTGWGGISAAGSGIEVPSVRIDAELEHRDIAVLKIDVEGAEFMVLQGCEALLREKRIGCIFFEFNPDRAEQLNGNNADVLSFLDGLGYQCTPFNGDPNEWIAKPL